ncbi:phage prohead protein [[Mycoplasma] gypis]|uniref:Phage prohead protein n=1 Tax=[Mycoplasma] gypis TaxID=92404 RepID=A0ABZ2RQ52_9BACT|nr:phage prohead protein [[Mycoplasma] gypis]MBN0919427.1 phage prohead protein [[Mycoplasma] gypis]
MQTNQNQQNDNNSPKTRLYSYSSGLVVRNTNEENKTPKRAIELSVKLDSWSPVYKNLNGQKYREKIAPDCFDYNEPLERQKINSYLDHKIGIEHLLASTANNTLKIHKEANTIFATFEVNEQDAMQSKVANLIESGVVKSNSFIFEPVETSKNINKDKQTSEDVDFELIYKKARLISIDPVYSGFYPQDECRVFTRELKPYAEEFANPTEEDKNEQTQTKGEDEMNKEQIEKMLQDALKEYKEKEQANIQTKQQPLQEVQTKNEDTEKLQNLEQKVKELEAQQLTKRAFESLTHAKTQLNLEQLKTKAKNGTIQKDEISELMKQQYYALTPAQKTEARLINSVIFDAFEKRVLDGTTSEKGLALIETHTMPGVLTEWQAQFPEFTELAKKYPLTGLDTLVKNFYVSDHKQITEIAEAADSTALGGKTFKVTLSPKRHSIKISQNNALTHGQELWDAQTQNAKDQIIRDLRKNFYAGIFAHADQAMEQSTYTGGVTLEAKVETAEVGKFTFSDLDAVITRIVAEYGEGALSGFVFATHPDILSEMERSYINNTQSSFINLLYNPQTRTYRGLPILLSQEFPTKKIAKQAKVGLLFKKEAVCAYGLTFMIADDPYTDLSKDITNRYVSTRGEIKLIDPFVNSRYIFVKNN